MSTHTLKSASSHHKRSSVLSRSQHSLSLSRHEGATQQVSFVFSKATFSYLLFSLTLIVIAFQTMESSAYLKAIQSNTQAFVEQFSDLPVWSTAGAGEQIQNATEIAPPPAVFVSLPPPAFQNEHPMCQRLGQSMNTGEKQQANILNAGNLWHRHLQSILEASYFPRNSNGTATIDAGMQNIIHNLLLDLTPHELEQGVLTYPKSEYIERIWNILEARRENPETAPPLRVLVMGGSVVEGVGCSQPLDSKDKDNKEKHVMGRLCSWPVRLEAFVNAFLGYDAVKIVNIAQGGTSTEQATSQIKYWMYQSQMDGHVPDVIIHAFGSNDSHLGETQESEQERISLLHAQATRRLNLFMQTLQTSHPCPQPILIHLDDYFGGHGQGAMMGDFTYRMVLKEIAAWYGNFAVSSAQVVDELIYPDVLGEKAFSPEWYIKRRGPNAGKITANPHFGYGGHLAVMWTWMYSATKAAIQFCNDKDWEQHQQEVSKIEGRKSSVVENVNQLRGFLPPPLDYEMNIQQVSESMLQEKSRQEEHCSTASKNPPCIMAFVAGPEGQTSTKALLGQYLSPWFKDRNGWKFVADLSHGWARKLGIEAVAPNAAMKFTFDKVAEPVQILTVHSVKSYGEDWEGSAAEFSLRKRLPVQGNATVNSNEWVPIHTEVVAGVHNSTSSITYSTEMRFPAVEVGSDVELDIKLIGGSKFKITGMMLCSR